MRVLEEQRLADWRTKKEKEKENVGPGDLLE